MTVEYAAYMLKCAERESRAPPFAKRLASHRPFALCTQTDDSVHGPFKGVIVVDKPSNALVVDGATIRFVAEKEPANIPWGAADVDVGASRRRNGTRAHEHALTGPARPPQSPSARAPSRRRPRALRTSRAARSASSSPRPRPMRRRPSCAA